MSLEVQWGWWCDVLPDLQLLSGIPASLLMTSLHEERLEAF